VIDSRLVESLSLRYEHVRQLLLIAGEARELANDPEAQERHVLGRLRDLLHVSVIAHFHIRDFRAGGRCLLVGSVDIGWGTDSDRRQALGWYLEHGMAADPMAARLADIYQASLCTARCRRDLVEDRVWYHADYYNQVARSLRFGDHIYSARPTGYPGEISGIGLNRAKGERPFDEPERAVVRVFHGEILPRMQAQGRRARATKERLSPRERETLRCLLDGMSEKQVAAELGLSQNTVHQYVRAVYLRFGVSSRSELLARHIRPAAAAPTRSRG
jgi:DNA-binding CsgD family transcriptional regulator